MNVATKRMTTEEFRASEERQELRYKFDGVAVRAVVGGTVTHALLLRNLAIAVGGRLHGQRLQFIGSELKVRAGNNIRYPDG